MKKGIFTPLLVLFTLIVLIALAFTITKAEKAKQGIITGEMPVELIKTYNEGEKLSFYLDESVKVSLKNAEDILKENAGYPENNNCEKQDGIIVWNTCTYFNIEENFNKQFKEEIRRYLSLYPAQLQEPTIAGNKIEFKDIRISKDTNTELIKGFSVEYIINKEIEYPEPGLDVYNNIYIAAQSCNLKPTISDKEMDDCINAIKTVQNTEIIRNNDYLKIENNGIKLFINIKKPLQLDVKPITIA